MSESHSPPSDAAPHRSGRRSGHRRRRLFQAWVVLTVAVAAFVAFFEPLALEGLVGPSYVAYVVPPLMILLLGLSLGWLMQFVWRKDRRRGPDQGGT
ncbi:MAG: hypothetical protein WD341_10820 [Tistlia sp.]|uniref:hypothetical protein n=1 Tax=Tistlia sp. TaxID=3057121 RepID=UPI0034A37D65